MVQFNFHDFGSGYSLNLWSYQAVFHTKWSGYKARAAVKKLSPSYLMNLWPESVASNQQEYLEALIHTYLQEGELERVETGFY